MDDLEEIRHMGIIVAIARQVVYWSSVNYTIDPEYWIGVRHVDLDALDRALGNLDDHLKGRVYADGPT